MSRYFEQIRSYYRKGLYTARQLDALVRAGALSEAERNSILPDQA